MPEPSCQILMTFWLFLMFATVTLPQKILGYIIQSQDVCYEWWAYVRV